ncbi:MAG: UDP-N-acetylglucosamine 1-carboxyvinyltransferase [Ruminococcaceae bacterium]|nr:UDP-N-acetylglucosamine 1-carboxyvinyltransferase [Oscillospiraceae bacterium]
MEKYRICGGNRLSGAVDISGAKNAVVAILPAVILCDEPCVIENIPNISDVSTSLNILSAMGAKVRRIDRNTVEIDPRSVFTNEVDHALARTMRASYYFIGALLGKCGSARVPLPGGCWFGVRPIDLHLKGFRALGAQDLPLDQGVIELHADHLMGNSVYLDTVSVGATVNIMLAAVRARGMTIIENAAKEPHIVDLANFLNTMGADVRGAGTDVIKIRGVQHLHSATYSIIPDQIEAGTYMAMAVATHGDVLVRNVIPKHLESITAKLEEMGATIEEMDDAVRVRCSGPLHHCNVKTMPHPGFPTDMQPQIGVLLSLAEGTSVITEGIWENRFRYVDELRRMGAEVQVDGKTAVFQGVKELVGAPVEAVDLRAGAAMVIAGLAANGITEVDGIGYIERGYEDIVEKLTRLGADIRRIYVPEAQVRNA